MGGWDHSDLHDHGPKGYWDGREDEQREYEAGVRARERADAEKRQARRLARSLGLDPLPIKSMADLPPDQPIIPPGMVRKFGGIPERAKDDPEFRMVVEAIEEIFAETKLGPDSIRDAVLYAAFRHRIARGYSIFPGWA